MAQLQTNDLAKIVAEKIREQFVSLIPEDTFQELVKSNLDQFLNQPTCNSLFYTDQYNHPKVSPFVHLIQLEIRDKAKTLIKEELAKPEYQTQWDNIQGFGASEIIRKAIELSANQLVVNIVQSATVNVLNQLKSNML